MRVRVCCEKHGMEGLRQRERQGTQYGHCVNAGVTRREKRLRLWQQPHVDQHGVVSCEMVMKVNGWMARLTEMHGDGDGDVDALVPLPLSPLVSSFVVYIVAVAASYSTNVDA